MLKMYKIMSHKRLKKVKAMYYMAYFSKSLECIHDLFYYQGGKGI